MIVYTSWFVSGISCWRFLVVYFSFSSSFSCYIFSVPLWRYNFFSLSVPIRWYLSVVYDVFVRYCVRDLWLTNEMYVLKALALSAALTVCKKKTVIQVKMWNKMSYDTQLEREVTMTKHVQHIYTKKIVNCVFEFKLPEYMRICKQIRKCAQENCHTLLPFPY